MHKTNNRPRLTLPGCMVMAVALVLASCSSGARAPGPETSVTVATRHTSIGTVLTDRAGHTLYAFTLDTPHKSNCPVGACTALWPPLEASGRPHFGKGISPTLIGKIRRPGGHYQVTYGGHPLYTYTVDSAPGQTHGEALEQFGGIWYAVSPIGHLIKSR
ncbi:MAG: hypothetical protein M1399_06815 [Actinobacteria bacterium]|nr:hypothetical protein [Actinomycetota bacterium]MCL5446116.1 hypothetical protein [Actinomycetota bacterium]